MVNTRCHRYKPAHTKLRVGTLLLYSVHCSRKWQESTSVHQVPFRSDDVHSIKVNNHVKRTSLWSQPDNSWNFGGKFLEQLFVALLNNARPQRLENVRYELANDNETTARRGNLILRQMFPESTSWWSDMQRMETFSKRVCSTTFNRCTPRQLMPGNRVRDGLWSKKCARCPKMYLKVTHEKLSFQPRYSVRWIPSELLTVPRHPGFPDDFKYAIGIQFHWLLMNRNVPYRHYRFETPISGQFKWSSTRRVVSSINRYFS